MVVQCNETRLAPEFFNRQLQPARSLVHNVNGSSAECAGVVPYRQHQVIRLYLDIKVIAGQNKRLLTWFFKNGLFRSVEQMPYGLLQLGGRNTLPGNRVVGHCLDYSSS